MNYPDIINGSFEAFGFAAVGMNCLRLLKDKRVAGVSYVAVTFFTSWGFWNAYYYPHLGQTLSGFAAVMTCSANCLWLGLMIKYRKNS